MSMKTCPHCKALTHIETRVCPGCDRKFADAPGPNPIAIGVIVAVVGACLWLALR